MDVDSIRDSRSSHLECDPFDIRGVVRKHPQSEGGCNSTSLYAGNGIVGETPGSQESDFPDICPVADKSPGDELE